MAKVDAVHVVHLENGIKIKIYPDDTVEIYLKKPLKLQRQHWTKYLTPEEEANRSIAHYSYIKSDLIKALSKAYSEVPMHVYKEED